MLNQPPASDLAPPGNGAGAREKPDTDILDAVALNDIRALQKPGKPDILQKIALFFLDKTPRLIQTMRDAVSAKDADALLRAAHFIKTSSANLGALGLARLCEEIEEEARRNSIAQPPRIDVIEHEFLLVREALRVCIGDNGS